MSLIPNAVSLSKGARADLTKGTGVTAVNIALSWDARSANAGDAFDLDAFVFALNSAGKCADVNDFVFFNQLKHPSGAIEHSGDELTGSKAGDDEVIKVDFAKMPAHIERLVIVVNIYDAVTRRQNFGMVRNAKARIDNATTSATLYNFDLSENASTMTAVVVGEVYRAGSEWKFAALGETRNADLSVFCTEFAVPFKN